MKRRSMKKAVTVLMGMAMTVTLFTAAVPANACGEERETAAVETVVAPRAVACPHCGSSVGRHTSVAWNPWYRTGNQRNCDKHPWGIDLELQRDGMETITCSQCGFGISSQSKSEFSWECHGFD